MTKTSYSSQGFSLPELVLVAGILAFALTGLIRLYIYTSVEGALAGNKTVAVSEAQDKLEEIRNHDFSLITADYGSGGTPGNVFDLSQLDGKGIIYIDSSNSELLVIKVVVCWRDKYDRIIGGDLNLNGQYDTGEPNVSGQLTSPVTLMTMITRR